MKKPILLSTIIGVSLSLLLANGALADRKHHHKHHDRHHKHHDYHEHHEDYARVVDADPIYQQIATEVPEQSCRYESVAYREPGRSSSHTGTIVGGLIGAAVGHELGHSKRNKQVGAIAGGIVGATVGHDISRHKSGTTHYRDEKICHTSYRTEYTRQLVGYDVIYKYHGQLYQTRTDRHPGKHIAVASYNRPVHYARY